MGAVGGAVSDLFGGAPNNAGFVAQAAPITNPVTGAQISNSYDMAQSALTGQQQLATQLAAQNGLQNQQNVFGQQQNLANILQNQAAGTGANPAQAALNQNTSANIANQAALMGGQRGASANAGLIARQAAQQGAGIQQQAVGQSATMQAQQQIAAQQQLAAQQQAMQQVAGNQVGNQLAGQGAYTSATQGEQGQLLGAQGAFNNAQVASTSSQNAANSAMAQQNAKNSAGLFGGLIGGAGAALGSGLFSGAAGGLGGTALAGGAGEAIGGAGLGEAAPLLMLASNGGMVPEHLQHMANIYHAGYSAGGMAKEKVPAMVSPGEKYIPPEEAKKVAKGEKSISSAGEKIPGKPQVQGDSPKNDTVPKDLEAGGIVIPRSVMESKDPVKEGTKFLVEALKKGGKSGGGKEESDFHHALKKAIASRGAA